MMVGNSLQGTLLGVRATIEDFSVMTTGFIMTAYYVGYVAGSFYVPKLVARVGHIRVFAALASAASTTVLFHGLFVDPWAWSAIRIITGFSYAGLYIVVESWLNDASTNESRGRMLGLYLVVTYAGMVAGQFLLNIASPSDIELFVVTSALVSLALLPIALSSRPAPEFHTSEPIKFKTIWSRSPLGVFGVMVTGLISAIVFSLGSVFILDLEYSVVDVSYFMAAFIFGGVVLQMPVSWVSDKIDRRKVIIGLCALSLAACGVMMIGYHAGFWVLTFGAFLLGAVGLPIYGQCVSHVNDHLLARQFVAASGTLVLLNGAGSMIGPLAISFVMQWSGGIGFILSLIAIFTVFFVFGLYRAFRVESVPLEDQGDSFYMPARGSAINVYAEDVMEQYQEDLEIEKTKKDWDA